MTVSAQVLALVERAVGLDAERCGCVGRVERLAARRARQLGLPSAEAWAERVASGDPDEARALIEQATIGFTFQGRGEGSLEQLVDALQGPTVRLWCAGCSTGEEVVAVARLLAERGLEADIVATDVHAGRVKQAEALLAEHALGARVTLLVHNLATEEPPPGGVDAVVCRNVTMYFSPRALRHVAAGFQRVLRPGGQVLLAPHEQLPAPFRPMADGDGTRWRVGSAPPSSIAAPLHRPAPSTRGSSPPRLPPPVREPQPWAHVALGNEALRQHRFAEALARYQTGLALCPHASEIHTLVGVVHRKQGHAREAERSLRRALLYDDRFWPAAWLLAGVVQAGGDRAGAERLRQSALADAQRWPAEQLLRGRDSERVLLPDDPEHPLHRPQPGGRSR